MTKAVSPRATVALVAVGLGLVALVSYFLLIAPKRSEAARLTRTIESTKALVERQRATARPVQNVEVADLFRLTKAMPSRTDMPGVVLELGRIASASGVTISSLTPSSAPASSAAPASYEAIPLQADLEGSFYELTGFLRRVRTLVRVQDGDVSAKGRLFTIDSVTFNEGETGDRELDAILALRTFVYRGGSPGSGPTGDTG